ncbi:MAG: flagellar export chaperone FliS [Vampirovibrionales bacterium]|nr:flagellar export chaperone FliS [Vampirovibrionales bacterium]
MAAYSMPQKNQPHANTYLTQQVMTATPEQLMMMLYDGAIQAIKTARSATEKSPADIATAHRNLKKAQNIIMEFMNTLDFEQVPEFAPKLYALYEYLYFRLVEANIKKNVDVMNEVLWHMQQLRTTWDEAIRIAAKERHAQRQSENPDAFQLSA